MTFRMLILAAATAGFATAAAANDDDAPNITENDGDPGASMDGFSGSYSDVDAFGDSYDASGDYDRFDANADGTIDRDEFNRGMFARFDADGDGMMNDDESASLNAAITRGNPDAPK